MTRIPFWALLLAAVAALLGLLIFLRPPAPHGTAPAATSPTPTPSDLPELVGQEELGRRWLRPVGGEAAFAGDEACRTCHAAEFRKHAASPHARTVRRLTASQPRPEFASGQELRDPVHGISYRVEPEGRLTADAGGAVTRTEANWAFGSGSQALTYLSGDRDRFLELRITYYSRWREWGFTPGQGPTHTPDQPAGRVYTPLKAASCFGCHSTLVVGDPSALDLQRSLPGIGCEACHGPSRRHVEAAERGLRSLGGTPGPASLGSPRRAGSPPELEVPPRPTGARVMEVCGACHRMPEAPGSEPIAESELARLTGIALGRSRCYRESGGRLTCLTCHDPHAAAAKAPTAYDTACRGCHGGSAGSPCRLGKTSRCAGCHMRAPAARRDLPLLLHDHWIR